MQALVGIVMTVAIPYMINPDQANWRGKIGFFYGEQDFVSVVTIFCTSKMTTQKKGPSFQKLASCSPFIN